MHQLLGQLLQRCAGQQASPRALKMFWSAVAKEGTPLLTPLPGGGYNATFAYRPDWSDDIRQVVIMWDGDDWFQTHYRHESLPLTRLAGTDLWYGDIDIPAGFCGTYFVALGDEHGIINEDVHERWPMCFPDRLNPARSREPDTTYARSIARAPRAKRGPGPVRGTVVQLSVDATHLDLQPTVRRHQTGTPEESPASEHPVWVYLPAAHVAERPSQTFPVAVLLSGQILEGTDFQDTLDRAIADGRLPPIVVVAPGETIRGHTAWGTRRGGPVDQARFVRDSLWPLIRATLPVESPIHLVAWGPAAPTALRTVAALHSADRLMSPVGSLTLLNPYVDDTHDERYAQELADLRDTAAQLQHFGVAVGVPSERSGAFTWQEPNARRQLVNTLTEAGVSIHAVSQSDPNMIAAIDAALDALAHWVSGQDEWNRRRLCEITLSGPFQDYDTDQPRFIAQRNQRDAAEVLVHAQVEEVFERHEAVLIGRIRLGLPGDAQMWTTDVTHVGNLGWAVIQYTVDRHGQPPQLIAALTATQSS